MRKINIAAPIFLLLTQIANASELKLNGISIGLGDWINITNGDWGTREDYGTLPAAAIYFSGWGWRGSVGAPVKSAFKRLAHDTRFSWGDGDLAIGRPLGIFSPRLLLQVPLYKYSADNALENELFIGSGNVNLGFGLSAKAASGFLPGKWSLEGDIQATTAVTKALADYGSTHLIGVVQSTHALGNRWKLGANALLLFNYWKWVPSFWDQKTDARFMVLPGVIAGVRAFNATYIDAKFGLSVFDARQQGEPKYAVRPESAFNFGLSAYQGF